jgi:hypothetical protein
MAVLIDGEMSIDAFAYLFMQSNISNNESLPPLVVIISRNQLKHIVFLHEHTLACYNTLINRQSYFESQLVILIGHAGVYCNNSILHHNRLLGESSEKQ